MTELIRFFSAQKLDQFMQFDDIILSEVMSSQDVVHNIQLINSFWMETVLNPNLIKLFNLKSYHFIISYFLNIQLNQLHNLFLKNSLNEIEKKQFYFIYNHLIDEIYLVEQIISNLHENQQDTINLMNLINRLKTLNSYYHKAIEDKISNNDT